jgi:hypothetical protein
MVEEGIGILHGYRQAVQQSEVNGGRVHFVTS